jgi:hypothetical protein
LVFWKVEAHADVMPPIAESLVESDTVGEAAEDDFVAAEFPRFFRRVSYQRRADPLLLKVPVDGNILDVADPAASMDEFLFHEKCGRPDDLAVDDGDVRANAGPQLAAEDLSCFGYRQADFGEAGERFQEAFVDFRPGQFSDVDFH